MAGLAGTDSLMGQVVQAITAAVALIGLDRQADAAVTLAACKLACDELGWTPGGVLGANLQRVRDALSPEHRAHGRRRADELGMDGGLQWVQDTALAGRCTG